MAATTTPVFDTTHGVAEANLCNIALAKIGVEPIQDTDPAVENSEPSRACRRHYAATRDELLRDYEFNFARKIGNFNENTTYAQPGNWDYVYDPPPSVTVLRVLEVDNDKDAPFELMDAELFSDRYSSESYIFSANTNTSITLTGISATDIAKLTVGDLVTGTGIPVGATIATIGTVSATISAAATGSAAITVSSPRKLQARYLVQVVNPALFDSIFRDALALRLASKLAFPLTGKLDLSQVLQAEFAAIMAQAGITSSKEKFEEEGEELWTGRNG